VDDEQYGVLVDDPQPTWTRSYQLSFHRADEATDATRISARKQDCTITASTAASSWSATSSLVPHRPLIWQQVRM
jgi:hypothetical protein